VKIHNYDDVVQRLYSFLPQYLQEQGIDTSRNFGCINPSHEDSDPSCSITGGNDGCTFHCFGCGSTGNIFNAAHYLEDKPMVGKEFILDNVVYLATKYGIEVQMEELTDEELYELDTYRAYKAAAGFITFSGRAASYAADRGISEATCRTYGVGGVSSFTEFRQGLKRLGFPARFLDDVDLGRRDIFNENNLIFTIHDEKGRPVGFAARNLDFDKNGTGSKYVNQKTTGLKCNIYQKGKRLYGIHKAVAGHPLYIFEGYTDVLAAYQHGLTNCAAIGGTAFTTDHVFTLKENNFYDIVLCLDGDDRGQDKVEKLLDERLSGHREMDISVVTIPEDKDPDEYIRGNSIDEFRALAKWSAFEWRLNRYPEEEDPQNVCNKMVSLIVNEPNYIKQEQMCRVLAATTGFSLCSVHFYQGVCFLFKGEYYD